jgi:hypothetical protein
MGELAITNPLTIDGSTLLSSITIDAQQNSRVLNIDGPMSLFDVEILGVTLTGGSTIGDGGAIRNAEDLTIIDSIVSGNRARDGGGISHYQYGNLSITGCMISGNSAENDGGAISNRGVLIIIDSMIMGNLAGGEGGAIWNFDADVSVTRSTISGNQATGTGVTGGGVASGGGISNLFGGNVVIVDSILSSNKAADGGGIHINNANITVSSSTISGNMASIDGGGIYNHLGNLTISNSTISGNSSNNDGGGIYSDSVSQTTTIANSTVSGNTSANGGGIFNSRGLIVIRHSTITGNRPRFGADSDAGIVSVGATGTRTELYSTIVAGNNGGDVSFRSGTQNSFVSLGFNLIGTGNAVSAFTKNDLTNVVESLLAPLADNGGPTQTHALLAGSPAVDAGNPSATAGVGGVPHYDQRGALFARVFDGNGAAGARTDIGAFERQPNPLTGDYNFDGIVDAGDYVSWRNTVGSNTDLRADGDGDDDVDQNDHVVWRANFGRTLPVVAAGSGVAKLSETPTPVGFTTDTAIGASRSTSSPARDSRNNLALVKDPIVVPFDITESTSTKTLPYSKQEHLHAHRLTFVSQRDSLLALSLQRQFDRQSRRDLLFATSLSNDETALNDTDLGYHEIDQAFEGIGGD